MFIIIPLSLIVVSLVGILAIVLRKKSYLDKLYTLNSAGGGDMSVLSGDFSWKTFGDELFPELKSLLDKIEFNKYKTQWLVEVEKFLRKTRVVFLKIDRVSDSMIKKIRKININDRLKDHVAGDNQQEELAGVDSQTHPTAEAVPNGNGSMDRVFIKNEENRLIMEIAKNPKDAKLYEALGDLYMEINDFSDAKESYEAAIELSPQNEPIGKKLSSVLEKMHPLA